MTNYSYKNYDSLKQTPHYKPIYEDDIDEIDIYDLETARATSRKLFVDSGFYRAFIKTATDHTIGSGLKAKATLSRTFFKNIYNEKQLKELEHKIDICFYKWTKDCDITGQHNYNLLQRQIYQNFKVDGECFIYLVSIKNTIKIQIIEPKNITDIKYNKHDKPVEYHIQTKKGIVKIPKKTGTKVNIIHIFHKENPTQKRGLPFLFANYKDIKNIDDYLESEMGAAKSSAKLFATLEQEEDAKSPFAETESFLGEEPQVTKQTDTNIFDNVITRLNKNEKLKIQGKGRDNTALEKYIKTLLQKTSANIRIPIEIALAQFVNSYSASRAAMLLMEKFVKPERMLFNFLVNKVIKEQVLTNSIINGTIIINNYFKHKDELVETLYLAEPTGSVDRLKDAKALKVMIENNLETRTRATAELSGGEFEVNCDILYKEQELLKEKNLTNLTKENDE